MVTRVAAIRSLAGREQSIHARSMFLKISTTFAILVLTSLIAQAGDAVAIGYNDKGVWTAVMYYCSGTRKDGSDYKDAKGAGEAAPNGLKKSGGEAQATPHTIACSAKTG